MIIVCEIAAGVRDYSCVNKERREINNIIACVSSILCIYDNFRPKSTQIQSMGGGGGGGGGGTGPPNHYHLYGLL